MVNLDKDKNQKFLLIDVGLIISIPFIINLCINHNQTNLVLKTENRYAQEFKPLEGLKVKYIASFFDNFDKYISDHMIYRDPIVSSFKDLSSYIPNLQLKLSSNNAVITGKISSNNAVITGKNSFVFLSNKYNLVLDRHIKGDLSILLQKAPNLKKDHEVVLKKIDATYESSKKIGSDFFVLIAPDKHSIYCKQLPSYLSKDTCRKTQNITKEYLKDLEKRQINFIYPFDELQSKSLQKQTYYKTDSHWNMLGAETAFFSLINKISEKGTVFNKEPFKKNDSYFLQEFANHNFGDLKDLANLNTNFPLDEKAYTVKLLVDPINKIYKEENPLIKVDGKMKFKNENASNKLKVLVIHDSFSVALSVFFRLFVYIYG